MTWRPFIAATLTVLVVLALLFVLFLAFAVDAEFRDMIAGGAALLFILWIIIFGIARRWYGK